MFSPVLVHEFLSRSAERLPEKVAVICREERWTYRALDLASDRAAAFFRSRGVRKGGRVAIFLDNSVETVISLYGALKAGGVFVVIDGSAKAKKLGRILRDAGPAVLVTHTDKASVVSQAAGCPEQSFSTVWAGDASGIPEEWRQSSLSWQAAIHGGGYPGQGEPLPEKERANSIDTDLAALIYTSGSSGEPKAVMVSHLNMVSAARSVIGYLGNRPDDIIMNVLPLSFGYGLYQVLMAVMFGGTVILERSFLFPVTVLERMERERATAFPLVPTMAALLVKLSNLDRFDLRSLRYLTSAAAALRVEHVRKLQSLFPGVRLFSMYGLTECKRVSYLAPEELDRRPASVGKAIPNSEVLVLNDAGQECAPGEVGELVVRGPHVACGYWNAPDLTARTFRPGSLPGERLLYSGDLFRRDEDGFLYYVGRKSEIIKIKGNRVAPAELESVLSEMNGVLESAVIGVPDDLLGQAIVAFVAAAGVLQERDVRQFCAARVQPFMVPRNVLFLAALPRSANGKVDKKKLASMAPGPGEMSRVPAMPTEAGPLPLKGVPSEQALVYVSQPLAAKTLCGEEV